MKHIELFEAHQRSIEPISLKSPVYQKGEVIIWSDFPINQENIVDYDFAERLLRRLGLKLIGEPYDKGFLVKCEPGKEEETAKMVIDKYPDFFTNYQREDIRYPYIYKKTEDISSQVEGILDFFESSIQRNVNTTKYNKYIDDIISELNKLKIN